MPTTPVRGMDQGQQIPRGHWVASLAKIANHIFLWLSPWYAGMYHYTNKRTHRDTHTCMCTQTGGTHADTCRYDEAVS